MGGEREVLPDRAPDRRKRERDDARDELDVLHPGRGRKREQQLDAVRAMIAEEHPVLARVLTREQVTEIWDAMHGLAVNAQVEERLRKARQRLRERWGDGYWMVSDAADEIRRIERTAIGVDDRFVLDVPTDALLDPAILQVPLHNIAAEMAYRMKLWDTLRSQPVRVVVDLRLGTPKLRLYWTSSPDRDARPIANAGGLITWDTLMSEGRFVLPYYEQVRNGALYKYLRQYHEALAGEILDWREEAQFIEDVTDDHPIASRVSFWATGRLRPRTPAASWFGTAEELNDQAFVALLEGRLEEASDLLTRAEEAFVSVAQRVSTYDATRRRGGGRVLTALLIAKEVGKFAGGVLTGRGPLAAGQFARAAYSVAAGTGAVSFAQDLAQQGSAYAQGLQDGIDFGGAAVRSGKDALVAAVATWTGLHAARAAHRAMRPVFMKYPGVPDVVRRHVPELLGGALAAPAATAATVGLNAATGEGPVPDSIGELGGMVIDDITIGALLQVGLSPMIGRLDGSKVRLKPPSDDNYARGTRGVMTMYHGTDQPSMKALDAGIDVAHSGYPHDFGGGFYATPERAGADAYASRRGEQRGAPGAVAETHVRVADLGRIVDVRPGGAHRSAWERFLRSKAGPIDVTWGQILKMDVEMRATAFETFLRQERLADADTIFGPLGDDFTGGITGGATTQVSIRSPEVAAHLGKLGLLWSAPRPP